MKRPLILILFYELFGIYFYHKFGIFIFLIYLLFVILLSAFLLRKKYIVKELVCFAFICVLLSVLSMAYRDYRLRQVLSEIEYNKKFLYTGFVENIKRYEDSYELKVGFSRVYIKELKGVDIGDKVVVSGKAKPLNAPMNFYENDRRYMSYVNDIYFNISPGNIMKIKGKDNLLLIKRALYNIKFYITDRLRFMHRKVFEKYEYESMTTGFVLAAVLGDKSIIDENLSDSLQKSGTSHILAISGLHISLIGMAIYSFLRKKLKMSYFKSACTAALIIILYSITAGYGVSIKRACFMLITAFIANIRGRDYDLINSAAVILILSCIFNPYEAMLSSTALSFGAVFSIGICDDFIFIPLYQKKSVKLNSFYQSIIISAVIFFVNLPVVARNYYYLPFLSIIINLIVIPLACISISLSILLIPMSFVFYTGYLFLHVSINNLLIIIKKICDLSLYLKMFRFDIGYMSDNKVFLYYLCIAFIYFIVVSKIKLYKKFLIYIFDFMILMSIFIKFDNSVYVSYINVGQGDSIFINVNNKNLLIDSGSTTVNNMCDKILYPYLLARRETEIDKAFITHADADHCMGIIDLMKNHEDIKIKELYLPYVAEEDERYEKIINTAIKRGVKINYIKKYDIVKVDKLSLICLSPSLNINKEIMNDHSIVLLMKYNNHSLIFTGDAGENCELEMLNDEKIRKLICDADVLKVGHHGSFTSSCEEFLKYVKPEFSVISYGEYNRYGHPNKEALARLKKHSDIIFETAKDGEICIYLDKRKLEYKKLYRK